ncbi:AAA family ATPase [Deinococcus sp. PEB2-63]
MIDISVDNIFSSWKNGRNALLYGPPATGKTKLLSELYRLLNSSSPSKKGFLFNPNDSKNPLSRPKESIPIPQPVKAIWTTFHQSYGYEDFIIGLKPSIDNSGTKLEAWAGILLDAAIELSNPDSKYKSVVIIIDEINRGNAARIFGEFMTFLDFDYRSGGKIPIPLPLRQIAYDSKMSEEIRRPGGGAVKLPEGFEFPKNIYIVATMNSVDRAAIPIDSALARRFDRIEMRPNLDFLSKIWGLDVSTLEHPNHLNYEVLNPFQAAYFILARINTLIASDLGSEFELGHGLLISLSSTELTEEEEENVAGEDHIWLRLAKIWDEIIFPQLEDRYSGRPNQLFELLYVDSPPPSGDFAWKPRRIPGKTTDFRAIAPVQLQSMDIDVIKRSFRWLAQ